VGGVVVRILVILADVFLLVASRKFTGTGANLGAGQFPIVFGYSFLSDTYPDVS